MAFKIVSGGLKLGTPTLDTQEAPKFKVVSGGIKTTITTPVKTSGFDSFLGQRMGQEAEKSGITLPTTEPKFTLHPVPEISNLTPELKSKLITLPKPVERPVMDRLLALSASGARAGLPGLLGRSIGKQPLPGPDVETAISKYPGASAIGSILGGAPTYVGAALTGQLPLTFGALGMGQEAVRQKEEEAKRSLILDKPLNIPQRAGRLAVAGAGGAFTGQIFKDADLYKTVLTRVLAASLGTGATGISEEITKEAISGRQPDLPKILLDAAVNAGTVGVTKALFEVPQLRSIVMKKAQEVAETKLIGKPQIKTYEDALKVLRQEGIEPEQLSPAWQRAKGTQSQEQRVSEATKYVNQIAKDQGWDKNTIREVLADKNKRQLMEGYYNWLYHKGQQAGIYQESKVTEGEKLARGYGELGRAKMAPEPQRLRLANGPINELRDFSLTAKPGMKFGGEAITPITPQVGIGTLPVFTGKPQPTEGKVEIPGDYVSITREEADILDSAKIIYDIPGIGLTTNVLDAVKRIEIKGAETTGEEGWFIKRGQAKLQEDTPLNRKALEIYNKAQTLPTGEGQKPPIGGGSAFTGQSMLKPGEAIASLKVVQTTKPADIKDVKGRKLEFGANDSIFTYPIVNQETGKFTGKVMLKDGDKGIVSLPKDLTPEQAKIEIEKRITGQKPFNALEESQVEEVVKGEGGISVVTEPVEDEPHILKVYRADDPEGSYYGEIGEIIKEKGGFTVNIPEVPRKTFSNQQEAELYISKTSGQAKATKFSQYQLPGGENYKEVLIKAPTEGMAGPRIIKYDSIDRMFRAYDKNGNMVGEAKTQDELKGDVATKAGNFKSSHWDEPNVLAHLRINDRTTPEGKKVLFIEEIQSDWARSAREKPRKVVTELPQGWTIKKRSFDAGEGFEYYSADENGHPISSGKTEAEVKANTLKYLSNEGAPTHPLLKNWQELALKNALKKAVDGGYDYIAWTTGEQQAERYDLSKQVDTLQYRKAENGTYEINIEKDGKTLGAWENIKPEEVEKYAGKQVAEKILKGEGEPTKIYDENSKKTRISQGIRTLKGLDLKIGGEWAKNLYDKQIPNILKDLTKGEIENINLGTSTKKGKGGLQGPELDIRELNQPALLITPEIRMRVIGQPIGGGSSFDKRKELMQKRLDETSLAREELQSLNAIRNQFRGRIQKYRGGYLKEELGGLPKYYITTGQGESSDKIIQEINAGNYGVELKNESELKDWLIGLEKRRKTLIDRIEANRPQLEAHKESTLLKQEEKIRQQEIKKFTGQAKQTATEAARITTRLEQRAFRKGKATAAEQRKIAYFGQQISKEERSKLYLMAKEKGLYYTDFMGKPHDILKGLLKFYSGASFDQLREYISNLTGDPENPPKLFKLFGDITKDTEVIKLLKGISDKWQDINKLETNTLDPARIVEKVTGQDLWDNILADNTFLVFAAADEAMYDRLVQLLNELDTNRQGVSKGSHESKEIMRKFEAGEPLTDKEQKVVAYLRKKYDALITEANEMRDRLNKRPIPYRKDYMTHIREQNLLSGFFKGDIDAAKNISQAQLDAIRKGDYTKGNMPFNRFALKRTGPKTKYDAIGNYEIYLRTMLKEIYYTPAITHARKFIEYALVRQPNAYIALDRLANDLKGKPSINDKWLGGQILSLSAIKRIRSLQAKSALLGNLNFWLMNASNFAVSYDELGNYMNKGMAKFLGTKKWRRFAFKHSNMLKGRTIDPDIDPGKFRTLEAAAGYITNLLEYNNVGSTFIGAYFKGIDQGYNQPKAIKYADAIARRCQVGYKKYELNAWMRSNSGMFLSQFQTWTFNAMNHIIYDLKLGNLPGNVIRKFTGKEHKPVRWGAFFTLIAISMLLNYLYKKAGLRQPYGPESATPRIPGIGGAVPPVIRTGQNIVTAIKGKKPETRQKAMVRAIGSFIPGGTQIARFFSGKILPQNQEEKETKKFPDKFPSKFKSKFKSKF